jgi:hypothetical protein
MKNNSNTENLIKLKESFNRAIDKRINESKINDAVGTLKDMSFNRLVDIFESISGNLMESKEGEKLIGRYLRLIKENKDLRGIYAVSNYIKKPMGINSSQAFINESISTITEKDKNRIQEGVEKLAEIVKESIGLSAIDFAELEEIFGNTNTMINESLDYIINNKRTSNNLVEWSNKLSNIMEYVDQNNKEMVNEGDISNKKPEELLSELEEIISNPENQMWESKVLYDISKADLEGTDKNALFEAYKAECLHVIDEVIEDKGIEEKARLNEMKSNLEGKQYNPDTITEDLVKMAELAELMKSE